MVTTIENRKMYKKSTAQARFAKLTNSQSVSQPPKFHQNNQVMQLKRFLSKQR